MVADELCRAADLRIAPVCNAVLHVGDFRRKLPTIELGTVRNSVRQVSGASAGSQGLLFNVLIVAVDGRMLLAGRNALSPGQRAHIDHDVRVQVLRRKCHAIRQDQTPLCVGVVDFHRKAGVEGVNVVRSCRQRSNRVLRQAQKAVERFLRDPSGHGSSESAEDAARTSHVFLHAGHARLGLDAQSTGVVDNALPNKDGGRVSGGRAGGEVRKDREGWRVRGCLADSEDPPKASPLQLVAFYHFQGDFRRILSAVRKALLQGIHNASGEAHHLGGVQDVARHVDQHGGETNGAHGLQQRACRARGQLLTEAHANPAAAKLLRHRVSPVPSRKRARNGTSHGKDVLRLLGDAVHVHIVRR
mmetsp:Transcript_2985/g.12078  ORF Transcript_2985/g.12078 Transcript_2985/m.12078 type:complete len:359 (-) Transcript_2985:395-1471(-)